MQRLTLFADVIVPLAVPNKYTYRVPFEMNAEAEVGKRVLVQFGKSKIYTGIIYNIHEKAPEGYTAKYIESVLDEQPVVTPLQLKFWDWISFYYCANPGDVMNAALPSGLKLSSTSRIQLNSEFNFEEISHTYFTEREHVLIDALHAHNDLDFDEIAKVLEVKSAQPIVHKLLKKNAIVVYEEVKEKFKPKFVSFIQLNQEYSDERKLHEILSQLEKKAFKQAEALMNFLHLGKTGDGKTGDWIKKSDLLQRTEASAVNALVKKKIFVEEAFETGRLLFEKGKSTEKKLSTEQQDAYLQIKEEFENKKPVLLQGVTGSGKTEIYIQLIHDEIKAGKEVLFLVPEIALTTQLITRLRAVFGEMVGVYHSRFSENERVEIWTNVLSQKAEAENSKGEPATNKGKKYKILLGARSSVFLPFNQLGLIIVDEEHDHSFKQQDPAPRYNARDSALYLAHLHGANVLLGSATPSLESYFNAGQKKYSIVKLAQQFVKGGGTKVEVCDINYFEQTQQMRTCLTQPLYEAIGLALKKKEQVILFQNRRGFAPYTECRQCGHVPHCIQCDVSLIYHKQNEKLVCHYCGYSISPPKTCSACGSNLLQLKGMGTEKIEEDIEILFPEARIARMDLDSTRSKYAYKQLLDDFENRQTDILVGTQMVTKGLDFEHVSVVGILNADSILNFPDFRSFERGFQLLTQVRGRAGRNNQPGKVFIQTGQPKHFVIESVLQSKLENFYSEILKERKQYNYPPYSRLFEMVVIGRDLNEVNHLSNELLSLLKPHFPGQLLGPEFPLISKIKNLYHKKILVKSDKNAPSTQIRLKMFDCINELHSRYKKWNFKVRIDVDPM